MFYLGEPNQLEMDSNDLIQPPKYFPSVYAGSSSRIQDRSQYVFTFLETRTESVLWHAISSLSFFKIVLSKKKFQKVKDKKSN